MATALKFVAARPDYRRWRGRPLVELTLDTSLPRGPHLQPVDGAARPVPAEAPVSTADVLIATAPVPAEAPLAAAEMLLSDCHILDGLGLHQICAEAAAEAVELLTSGVVGGPINGSSDATASTASLTSPHGLGRLFGAASG